MRYAGIMTGELSERTRDVLTRYHRIAMVGVSGNPTRASYRALVHMQSKGYTVYPVNPSYEEILGLKCYKSLLDIKEPVDIVDIFRRPETVTPLIGEALEIGAKVFWMQIGVINEDAAAKAMQKASFNMRMETAPPEPVGPPLRNNTGAATQRKPLLD